MVLSLKNIGKLAETQIAIDGITVIAGENDTGKSTVGKALFAVFNSFYDLDGQVRSEQILGVERQVSFLYDIRIRDRLAHGVDDITEVARDIVARRDSHRKDLHGIEKRILELTLQDEHPEIGDAPDIVEMIGLRSGEIARKVQEILNIPDEEIRKAIVEKKLDSEFNHQVTNLYSNQKGEIRLQIEDKYVAISVENNNVTDIKGSANLPMEAVYIDDPLILDAFTPSNFRYQPDAPSHREHLREKLFHDNRNVYIEKIIRIKKFENIYRKISSVCGGEIVEKKQAGYGYKSADSDKLLDVRNLSTGLKTFAILKRLLMNEGIKDNGVVILDEPEIHLHPEWQLRFAELIVLLHKEFGVHILLNTHSPYFLRAIQVYSAKYEMADKCRYYLSENSGTQAIITDVSDDVERIYAKLSKPLQDLEDERWRDDSMA